MTKCTCILKHTQWILETVSNGWKTMKEKWYVFVGLFVCYILTAIAFPFTQSMFRIGFQMIQSAMNRSQEIGGFISVGHIPFSWYVQILLLYILFYVFIMIFANTAINYINNGSISFKISPQKLLYAVIAAIFLLFLLSGIKISLNLLIKDNIYGIFVERLSLFIFLFLRIKILYFPLIIIETEANPIKALCCSWKLTDKGFFSLILMLIVFIIIALAGFVILGVVGIIYAIPLIIILWIWSFKLKFGDSIKQTASN
jgi:hypothetical protein